MAKNVIIERYTFTPGTRTIQVIGKNIRREQLLLISLDYNFRLIRWQICCFHVAAVRLILLVWSSKLR